LLISSALNWRSKGRTEQQKIILWLEFTHVEYYFGPPDWGFDVPLATALCKNLPAENA